MLSVAPPSQSLSEGRETAFLFNLFPQNVSFEKKDVEELPNLSEVENKERQERQRLQLQQTLRERGICAQIQIFSGPWH